MGKQIRISAAPVDPVVLGKIGSAYGIHGWLRLFSSTEKTESIFDYQPWFIKRTNEWQQIRLENWKIHNQNLIIKIRNIEDREDATLLTNYEIVIEASQLLDLDSGEYYWKDLMGCQVVTPDGNPLGTVVDLMETGSNDVLVVQTNLIQKRLIPFLFEVIKNVDLTTHVIKVDWDPRF